MSVLVIGLNHRSAPLGLLERMTVDEERCPKALADLMSRQHISETVLLSTCNRVEVYVFAETFHGAFGDVRDFLAEFSHVAPEEFSDYLVSHYDADAVSHLFNVACGLDSAVVGEHEIQGQVRDAWLCSQQEGACGSSLNTLFRHAVEVGKRARRETGLSRCISSVSHAATALAGRTLGGLHDREVVVLGAGRMGESIASCVAATAPRRMVVANRSEARAAAVAAGVGGQAVPLTALPDSLQTADVLIASTAASQFLLGAGQVAEVMAARDGRPLLIVDVAVPRDVEPSVGQLDGVTLLDMDDLREFADSEIREHQAGLEQVRAIIQEELNRFAVHGTAREVTPLISAFRGRAEELRRAELQRHMAGLSDAERAAVEAVTQGVVGKLLHEPTVRLKDAAGSPRGDRLAEALRDLFDL